MALTDTEKKAWKSHLWIKGFDLPICVKCGESPISLGFWGDDKWKEEHPNRSKPCPVACRSNYVRPDLLEYI